MHKVRFETNCLNSRIWDIDCFYSTHYPSISAYITHNASKLICGRLLDYMQLPLEPQKVLYCFFFFFYTAWSYPLCKNFDCHVTVRYACVFVHVWSFPFLSEHQSGAWHQTNRSNETTCHYHLSITSRINVLLCGLTASNMTTSSLNALFIVGCFPASTIRDAEMADLHCAAVI